MTHTVVIADDQDDLRDLLGRLIERHGSCRVVGEAANGRRALELVEELDPDVLLLDLGMPEMDGLEVLTALAGKHRPRTVVLTGFDDPSTHARVAALGAVACLVKGRDFRRVAEVIAHAAATQT